MIEPRKEPASLGPIGVVPPAEWCSGALVRVRTQYAKGGDWSPGDTGRPGMIAEYDGDRHVVWWHGYAAARPARTALRLDLTAGPLDFATRTLLYLVAPAVEQPLCAPAWVRHARQWTLSVRCDLGREAEWRFNENGVYHGYTRIADVPAELLEETHPRRALALALNAMAPT